MRINQKTYLLLGIIIGVSGINLYLLVFISEENQAVLHSISDANDLKVITERIAGTANSIASGNENDRTLLSSEISDFETTYAVLGSGGTHNGMDIVAVPAELKATYGEVGNAWQPYKKNAELIKQESVFDPEVKDAITYVLGKNGDLVSLSNGVLNDLTPLDRNYNRHKEIATEMVSVAKDIGEKTLLYSIGEDGNVTSSITQDRVTFTADLQKLEGVPLSNDEINRYGIEQENLIQIPRENSDSLRQLDPLWESVSLKLHFLETNTLLSKEFGLSLANLNNQRNLLLDTTTKFVNQWNSVIDSQLHERVVTVQALTIADILVFVAVMFSIRKSLTPLQLLTNAISRMKEGFYGEEIAYSSKDEIGDLATTINSMSKTILEKEQEAKKIDIAKDEFLAMITHELKTPLVPIQGYADILLGEHIGALNKNQKERLEIIRSSARTLLQLISDLLDAQKLDLGQLKIKKSYKNMKQTLDKTISSMSPQAIFDKISLKHNVRHDVYAMYDEDRIQQVLTNLIKNSMKAVSLNNGKIEISLEEKSDEIIISVSDNGKGIPKSAIENLFKKFYQVDTSSTREKGGSGLGLSICKGIVETHGGRIWVTSELSKGSTFYFTIPKTEVTKTLV